MSGISIPIAILGLAVLMIVHEAGHFFVARYFGMRVIRFSIGFGPAIYRRQPEGSPTTYQVALIPFLAYVQIAGMNPLEDNDPDDKGSYANAPVHARILTIFAGPFANYLVASVFFFIALVLQGQSVLTTTVKVVPNEPAAVAKMVDGDTIVEVAGQKVSDWEQVRSLVASRAEQPVPVVIERGGKTVELIITPKRDPKEGHGRIGVMSQVKSVPITTSHAAVLSLKQPPLIVAALVVSVGRMVMGKEKPELAGPVGIVREMAKAVRAGFPQYMELLGILSAYLAGFNLLPIPALDGGRLMFLGYEATTRKRPNARIEAHVHAVGLIMLLTLVAAVTVFSDLSRTNP